MFAQGSVAMMDASLNAADLIQKQAGWETNLAVYPYLDGAESACLCVGEVAAIAHNSSHIVDAARLVNFLMDTDSQITYAENVGYLPGVMSALNSTDIGIDPYLSPYVAGIEDTKALGHKGFSVYCVIRDELQRVLRKEITVQEYCVSLESKINQILQN
jgi:ABC-type glycerol-3-phosphate transport system substrate-binding protein